jgi:hypothetical protein
VGYSAIKSLAEGMKKAGSTDTEKLVAAFKGLQVPTPFGRITYRPEDNQSTMGGYVGRTKNEGGKGVMGGLPLCGWQQSPALERRSQENAPRRLTAAQGRGGLPPCQLPLISEP